MSRSIQALTFGLLPLLQFVAATPNPTVPAVLVGRDNGANTIGFSLSGTSWRTRSCNTGYFSTSGNLGNCCVNNQCNFLTDCVGSTIYYADGDSSTCASSTCGSGRILKTPGDQSPLTMYNCQSDWTATETPTTTTSSGSATTSKSSTPSTASASASASSAPTTSNVIVQGSTSSFSLSGATGTSGSTVIMTVTNSDGSLSTSTSIAAIAQASGSASPDTTTHDNNSGGGGSNAGAIAGGVVGGLAVLAILAGVIFFLVWKKKKAAKAEGAAGTTAPLNPDGTGPSSGGTPNMGETYGGPVPTYGQQNQSVPPPHSPYAQDYKVAPAGYANAPPQGYSNANMPPPGPQQLDGTPLPPQQPSELYAGHVQGPVEMPAASGYSR